jgi:hypothetical protein
MRVQGQRVLWKGDEWIQVRNTYRNRSCDRLHILTVHTEPVPSCWLGMQSPSLFHPFVVIRHLALVSIRD